MVNPTVRPSARLRRLATALAATTAFAAVVAPAAASAPAAARDPQPALEAVSPQGEVAVKDDKSCFTLTVKGHGFRPGEPVALLVGTDQATGALRGDSKVVTPGPQGGFPATTLSPCGITTHGGSETTHVCTAEDDVNGALWHDECISVGPGVVVHSNHSWKSKTVIVHARQGISQTAEGAKLERKYVTLLLALTKKNPKLVNQVKKGLTPEQYDVVYALAQDTDETEARYQRGEITLAQKNKRDKELRNDVAQLGRPKNPPLAAWVSWPLTVTG